MSSVPKREQRLELDRPYHSGQHNLADGDAGSGATLLAVG